MSQTMTMKDAVAKVASLNLPQLGRIYKRVVGQKPPKGTKLPTLQEALVDALKEQATGEGDAAVLNETAVGWLAEGDAKPATPTEKAVKLKKQPKPPMAVKAPHEKDSRIPPPGSVITRVWRDRTLEVTVTETGFLFENRPYRSLSRIAMELMGGVAVNGVAFFQLTPAAKEAAKRRAEREAAKEAEVAKEQAPAPKQEKPAKKAKAAGKSKSAKKSKSK